MTQRSPLYTKIGPRDFPRDLLTWTNGVQLGIQPTPAIQRQGDWQNPILPKLNLELRTWTNPLPPGVISNQRPPIRNYDWQNPVIARNDNRNNIIWTHSQQIPQPAANNPISQKDWIVPIQPLRDLTLRTWTNGLPPGAITSRPVRNNEFQNPIVRTKDFVNITWTSKAIFSTPFPPVRAEWANPSLRPISNDLISWTGRLPPSVIPLPLPSTENYVMVPFLAGATIQEATQSLQSVYLNISYIGTGTVTAQDIPGGMVVARGTIVTLTLGGIVNNPTRHKMSGWVNFQ